MYRKYSLTINIYRFMKKFLLFALVLCMASCTFVERPGTTMKTITIRVKAADWKYTNQGNNNYFYSGVDVPEITSSVFEYGEVKAYLVKDRGDSYYARKHALPYVIHKEEYLNGNWIFFTETVDFTYGKGWVEFNFRASDFAYEENLSINPEAMEFDVVITKP
jgi:hypothetical protein